MAHYSEMLLVSGNSPRVRANETAREFIKGFASAAAAQGINIRQRPMTIKPPLEALTEVAKKMGKKPAKPEELGAALEVVDRGEESKFLPTKVEMLRRERMGSLAAQEKAIGHAAHSLASQITKHGGGFAYEQPTLISVFMRHSENKGDALTEDGKKLAHKQGQRVALHLMRHFLDASENPTTHAKGKVLPAVVVNVSHGGAGQTPGQLDWALQEILGKSTKELGGTLSHTEGLVTLGYPDGRTEHLLLRKHGITHLPE